MFVPVRDAIVRNAYTLAMKTPTEAWRLRSFVASDFPVDIGNVMDDIPVDINAAADLVSNPQLRHVLPPVVHSHFQILPLNLCLEDHIKFTVLSACFLALWMVLVRAALMGRK